VLTQIAEAEFNLSKLQSMPSLAADWRYSFHATLSLNLDQLNEVLERIKTTKLKP